MRDALYTEEGLSRAMREAQEEGRELTLEEARAVAAAWHSGQGSAFYALSSSGHIDVDALHSELSRCIDSAGTDVLELNMLGTFLLMFAKAKREGEQAAQAAATWVADGNTKPEAIRYVLGLMAEGDPSVDDYLPRRPDLSGEWAGDPTPLSLARDITGDDEPDPGLIDAIAEAWEEGVSESFAEACEAGLRKWVA